MVWPETPPRKFIVWGLSMYESTHSYIHYGFDKAGRYIGWDTEWVTDTEENRRRFELDCDGFLFLTLGGSDKFIPKNKNAFYILHNCDDDYSMIPNDHRVKLQVFTTDVYTRNVENFLSRKYEFWQEDENVFYMPWATDILPYEIDANISKVRNGETNLADSSKGSVFLGCVWNGTYGNINELARYEIGTKSIGIPMFYYQSTKVPQQNTISILQDAYITPTVVGKWQKEKGYIPCRIFKTISYGKLGVTNSKQASDIIDNLVVYDTDEMQLARKAREKLVSPDIKDIIIKQMELVRDRHTYIHRLDSIQKVWRLKKTCVVAQT